MTESPLSTAPASTAGQAIIPVALADLDGRMRKAIQRGWRLGLITARPVAPDGALALVTLMLDPQTSRTQIWQTALAPGARAFPSLTPHVPQAHWFERALFDFFGLRPEGHPRPKSVILHEAWPEGFHPLRDPWPELTAWDVNAPARAYKFLTVKGEGVYEIPVGPIHAGIIEPGHFRFSCLGEVIQNLEIRLGYQHRGIERQLTQVPWPQARFLAEAVSTDTPVGNALAHALAVEQILGIEPPPRAIRLRAAALEIERLASHIGDLGGVCSDIGYAGGAAIFGRLRGRALGLGERLTGARLMTAYVQPGGVAGGPSPALKNEIVREAAAVGADLAATAPLLLDNAGALERMEGTGRVRASLARDFGLVGPVGRASGVDYDVRRAFRQPPYEGLDWQPATAVAGDVLARVQIRVEEARTSAHLIQELLSLPAEGPLFVDAPLPQALPPGRVGVGLVEAWRGELIHLIFTDEAGRIDRYSIKDPSFNNWTGLTIAVRGELVSDFPLCNKSFSLSYSGNDL